MTEEELEEKICNDCKEPCAYYLYVYQRGHDRKLYADERCDYLNRKLKEIEEENK